MREVEIMPNMTYDKGEKAFAEEGLVRGGRHYRRDGDLSS